MCRAGLSERQYKRFDTVVFIHQTDQGLDVSASASINASILVYSVHRRWTAEAYAWLVATYSSRRLCRFVVITDVPIPDAECTRRSNRLREVAIIHGWPPKCKSSVAPISIDG
jgi:hypothetical protein